MLQEAVDRYRHADDASRAAQAGAVAAVSCTDDTVCATKSACVAAVEPTTRALALKNEAAARMADLEARRLSPDAPEAEALPGQLDEAARLLRIGREKMTECERGLADLRIKYGG
jgi:hypothetical protein